MFTADAGSDGRRGEWGLPMVRRPSAGLIAARLASRERITAGHGDQEAAERYRALVSAGNLSPETAADYAKRAVECERLAKQKLTGRA